MDCSEDLRFIETQVGRVADALEQLIELQKKHVAALNKLIKANLGSRPEPTEKNAR
jgi:hypothetical protein